MAHLSGIFLLLVLTAVASKSISYDDPVFGQPEQIHISYGRTLKLLWCSKDFSYIFLLSLVDPSLMVVTWITMNPVNDSIVEYGENGVLNQRATGNVSIFQDSGTEKRREYVHRVVLRNLKPGHRYCMGIEHFSPSPSIIFL